MKYTMEQKDNGITIEISGVEGKENQLLQSFQECSEGRCSCPTNEYTKLESLGVDQIDGKIVLQLQAKEGSTFDTSEIGKCLDHTSTLTER